MDCERAKQLIDLKVDAMVGPPAGAPGGTAKPGAAPGGMAKLAAGERRHVAPEPSAETLAELDAHLATCPTCAADYRELLRTRELLADLAAESPTEQEMNKMLTTLQSTERPTASREGEAPAEPSTGWHGSESPRDEASQTRARREDRTDRAGWPTSSEVGDTKIQPTRTRRAFVGPLVAAGLAIAACLGIAYTIGQQHYDAPARYTAAVSPHTPLPTVEEGRTDQPRAGGKVVLGTELRRLESLGYQGPPASDAKSTDHDYDHPGEISYGYQVPNGTNQPPPAENADAKMGLLPDTAYHGHMVVGGRGAFKPQDAAGREAAGGSTSQSPFLGDGTFSTESAKAPPPQTPPLPEAAGGTGRGYFADAAKAGETLRGAASLGFDPSARLGDAYLTAGGEAGGTATDRGDTRIASPPPTPPLPEAVGGTAVVGRAWVADPARGEESSDRKHGTELFAFTYAQGPQHPQAAPGVNVGPLDTSVGMPLFGRDTVSGCAYVEGLEKSDAGRPSDWDWVLRSTATAAGPSDNYYLYLPAQEVPGLGARANTLQSGDTGAGAPVPEGGDDTLATYLAGVSPTRYGDVTVVSSRNPEPGTEQRARAADAALQLEKAYAEARQPEALPAPAAAPAPTSQLVAQPRPKIIKTGELGVEVPEYAPAYQQVQTIVAQFRAFVADVNSQEGPGGAVTSKVTIRVVPEEFEALFGALKAVGRVESENVKAADVTAQYVDLEARIKASQINEERLQELVKSKSIIDKMSALLEVERELARVRTEIEQMQGQLRVMADRIGLSTLAITLREPARVVPSAALSVEVPVLADAADTLGKALEERGARLTSGKISRRKDGTFQGDYQLEVTLDHFDDVLHAIESLGRVEDRQLKDRRFSDATALWAAKVKCPLALVLYESAREMPKGEATVEVEALAAALTRLSDLLKTHGGSIAANRTSQRDDGSSLADLKLAVPAGSFAAFAAALDTLGRVTGRQLSGEAGRVVGGAADVMCDVALRLAERQRQIPSGNMTIEVEKFEPARQQISALVAQKGVQVLASGSAKRSDGTTTGQFRLGIKAADMETVVGRLEALGRVDARAIAGLGLGDLSTIDPNTVGVIDLSLHEKAAISPSPARAGDSIRAHFTDGLAGLYRSAGLIVYGLMTMVPWVLLTGVALWIIARVFRKRPAAAAAPAAKP